MCATIRGILFEIFAHAPAGGSAGGQGAGITGTQIATTGLAIAAAGVLLPETAQAATRLVLRAVDCAAARLTPLVGPPLADAAASSMASLAARITGDDDRVSSSVRSATRKRLLSMARCEPEPHMRPMPRLPDDDDEDPPHQRLRLS